MLHRGQLIQAGRLADLFNRSSCPVADAAADVSSLTHAARATRPHAAERRSSDGTSVGLKVSRDCGLGRGRVGGVSGVPPDALTGACREGRPMIIVDSLTRRYAGFTAV